MGMPPRINRALLTTLLFVAHLSLAGRAPAANAYLLDGYFHPGRCMPVRVSPGNGETLLSGDGMIPTIVPIAYGGVVPVLVLEAPVDSSGQTGLRVLSPNDRLIAIVGSSEAAAAVDLFPNEKPPIVVRVDPSVALTGPSLAWETLDAVVLDRPPEPEKVEKLLAMGVVIAMRTQDVPDHQWPWRREGELWVVRPQLVGPGGAIGGEAVHLPTVGWDVRLPSATKRQIVLAAALVSLLLISALLVRHGRRSIVLLIALPFAGAALNGFMTDIASRIAAY